MAVNDTFISKTLKYNTLKKSLKQDATSLTIGTIDSLHMKSMDFFNKQISEIPRFKKQLKKMENDLAILENKPPKTYTLTDISKKAMLKENIENMIEKITRIENADDEMDYIARALPIIEKHYNNNEQINIKKKVVDIVDFFAAKRDKNNSDEYNMLDDYIKCTMNKSITTKKKKTQIQLCPYCNIEKTLQYSDGHMVCVECGHSDRIIVDMEKINFKDPFYENKSTGYKRMNHFSELMNQFQAKETTEISQQIYNSIIIEIKKQKIKDPNRLSKKIMRNILKKLELNQYFEHIPFIINRLTGAPPPTITREIEEKLKQMFKEIQEPFRLYKPSSRKNFLNYNYVFHKFFELLEMDHFLQYFPLLKSPVKLREQEEIYEKICKHLKWEFIPS
jgi:Zn ribbon nucleic-acid-binding protein